MKNIQAVKIGNMVNVSIDGKLFKKNCGSNEIANDFFKLALKAKADPSDNNVNELRTFMNEKLRIAFLAGLETDIETGEVYLEGFTTPVPDKLVEVIKEYHDNNYPMEAILNFWKLLMINPDKRIRTRLFDFITTHDFVLTDKGYMVVYKSVYVKDNKKASELADFVSNRYLHVKKNWKCSPNKYVVYEDLNTHEYAITKYDTVTGWMDKNHDMAIEVHGKLGELFEAIFTREIDQERTVYTDMHSRTMDIQLGMPVKMDRSECDGDPANECSYGLHVGATKYVESFANRDCSVLVCLVNPANVVAVPNYDHSKIRVSEYFPFAMASYEQGKIDIIEQPYFEDDYLTYEMANIQELIDKVKAEELPIQAAMKAENEDRSMPELMKMLENRMVEMA